MRTPTSLLAIALPALAVSFIGPIALPNSNPVDSFSEIMCDSDLECEEATGYPYSVAMLGDAAPKYPRLVGIGCKGTNGAPIYAFEEDHFPVEGCREVFAMDWDWQERMKR